MKVKVSRKVEEIKQCSCTRSLWQSCNDLITDGTKSDIWETDVKLKEIKSITKLVFKNKFESKSGVQHKR